MKTIMGMGADIKGSKTEASVIICGQSKNGNVGEKCGQCMWSGEVSVGQSAVAELASGPRFGRV